HGVRAITGEDGVEPFEERVQAGLERGVGIDLQHPVTDVQVPSFALLDHAVAHQPTAWIDAEHPHDHPLPLTGNGRGASAGPGRSSSDRSDTSSVCESAVCATSAPEGEGLP